MPEKRAVKELPAQELRWRMDPATLPFETTDELKPLKQIIGQERGVEAFRFGLGIDQPGYNIFVTGVSGTGRLSTVRRLLHEMTAETGNVPDDLCYVNNFKNPDNPILLKLAAGTGRKFKKDIHDFLNGLKKEVPQLFESQDYLNRKKEIVMEYEKKGKDFFKDLDKKVREQGFTLVDVQVGQVKRPEVMPLVDGNPTHIDQIEALVEKGRFPKEEYEQLKENQSKLRHQIDQIFLELRDLQKEFQENIEQMDRIMFMKMATEFAAPIREKHSSREIEKYLKEMLDDLTENLQIFQTQQQPQIPGLPFIVPEGDPLLPYQVNLLVDNADLKGPPVIIESHPTYRNLFGIIERVVDRSGVWRTDYSRIRAGSLVKANGGYLVLNLLDSIMEPGVWPALKRSLRTKKMEIQTYDPFYLMTTSGLKPEPIELNVKVVIISDANLYHLLHAYDEDVKKIFKVRADFGTTMDKNEESVLKFSEFVKTQSAEDGLRPLDRTGVAAVIEQAVRMTGRKEKISTSFSMISDILREANYWAGVQDSAVIKDSHVERAIDAKIFRSNRIEEMIQEMIDRGTLMIDVDGEVVGQVNGLAVFSMGDYMFGKPTRITATTSMGRSGIINIEREADLSGSTHNKGVLILSGYLRKRYAQEKPLTMSASLAFEQSYSGVDGDSASSTEIYALLSSLSGLPIKQSIAVTGSVNQKGEIQPIGGVNEKIEGFFDCCKRLGFTGKQGVMIPENNAKDLMLRKDVVEAVKKGEFHVYPVRTVDQGMEILTGKTAGQMDSRGNYPKGTVNALVNEKLSQLAEGLKEFGEGKKKSARKRKGTAAKKD
ncbi:MAG: ATP-binding protein [Desulfobacteraceae bacterium]|nr:MAG: ATP-binding protein [Desulfobacteraceae bacterium]